MGDETQIAIVVLPQWSWDYKTLFLDLMVNTTNMATIITTIMITTRSRICWVDYNFCSENEDAPHYFYVHLEIIRLECITVWTENMY